MVFSFSLLLLHYHFSFFFFFHSYTLSWNSCQICRKACFSSHLWLVVLGRCQTHCSVKLAPNQNRWQAFWERVYVHILRTWGSKTESWDVPPRIPEPHFGLFGCGWEFRLPECKLPQHNYNQKVRIGVIGFWTKKSRIQLCSPWF